MDNIDWDALNSATKYPSIPTYHKLDRGKPTEERELTFAPDEKVIFTEKVNGAGARIVRWFGGDYVIGSREHFVHAKGDRIISPIEGIAEHLRHVADSLSPFPSEKWIEVLYFEVYGGKIGSEARQYTSKWEVGHRLFDVAYVDPRVLTMTVADIAKWREDGGQNFAAESTLQRIAEDEKLPLVPRLGTVDGGLVPTTREQMYAWLMTAAHTGVALDDKAGGQSEGMVMRTANRKQIVKARIPDYARVCKPTN